MTWISVKERLPECDYEHYSDVVLIATIDGDVIDAKYSKNKNPDWCMWKGAGLSVASWGDGDAVGFFPDEVTHWMPLPEPPKEGE